MSAMNAEELIQELEKRNSFLATSLINVTATGEFFMPDDTDVLVKDAEDDEFVSLFKIPMMAKPKKDDDFDDDDDDDFDNDDDFDEDDFDKDFEEFDMPQKKSPSKGGAKKGKEDEDFDIDEDFDFDDFDDFDDDDDDDF